MQLKFVDNIFKLIVWYRSHLQAISSQVIGVSGKCMNLHILSFSNWPEAVTLHSFQMKLHSWSIFTTLITSGVESMLTYSYHRNASATCMKS